MRYLAALAAILIEMLVFTRFCGLPAQKQEGLEVTGAHSYQTRRRKLIL